MWHFYYLTHCEYSTQNTCKIHLFTPFDFYMYLKNVKIECILLIACFILQIAYIKKNNLAIFATKSKKYFTKHNEC
jgi:hypothetical protein